MAIEQMSTKECASQGFLKPDPRFMAELAECEKESFGQAEITGKILKIAHSLHIPSNLMEDAIQEGWVAHLSGERIQTALNRWWKHERLHYQREHSVDPEHIEVGVYGYEENGIREDDLGLQYDQYNGWVPDDI